MDDINTVFSANSWLLHRHSIADAAELPHGRLWHPNRVSTTATTTGEHSPPQLGPNKKASLPESAPLHTEDHALIRVLPAPPLQRETPQTDQNRSLLNNEIENQNLLHGPGPIQGADSPTRRRRTKEGQPPQQTIQGMPLVHADGSLAHAHPSEPPAPPNRPPDYAPAAQQPPQLWMET